MFRFLYCILVLGVAFGCTNGLRSKPNSSISAPVEGETGVFPLSLSASKSHFVDASGNPFLMVGDAGWSLAVQLTKAEVVSYLDDRKSRGFNTILFSIIEHGFSSQTPKWLNQDGEAPFTDVNDFTTTNETYFEHIDYIVEQALERDILLFITPSYIGYNCGAEGWCTEMQNNGTALLTQYGQFLGDRYKDYPNIVWVHSGDYTPTGADLDNVKAIADGIMAAENNSDRLHTIHLSPGDTGSTLAGIPWLKIDTVYTYAKLVNYHSVDESLNNSLGVRPTIFFEGAYENENGATPIDLRAQMFIQYAWAGAGFIFGNSPVWKFDTGWQAALNSAGNQAVTMSQSIMKRFAWHTLEPDINNNFMTTGYGTHFNDEFVVSSLSTDKKLAIAYYTDNSLNPTFDVSQLAGSFTARWVDPVDGADTMEGGGPFSNTGTRQLTPPGANSGGDGDWLLVLEVQ